MSFYSSCNSLSFRIMFVWKLFAKNAYSKGYYLSKNVFWQKLGAPTVVHIFISIRMKVYRFLAMEKVAFGQHRWYDFKMAPLTSAESVCAIFIYNEFWCYNEKHTTFACYIVTLFKWCLMLWRLIEQYPAHQICNRAIKQTKVKWPRLSRINNYTAPQKETQIWVSGRQTLRLSIVRNRP